ncbi:hypothetical protein QJQ45_022641, partial [Haematococcus lacustris]
CGTAAPSERGHSSSVDPPPGDIAGLLHPSAVSQQWRRLSYEVLLFDTAASRPVKCVCAAREKGSMVVHHWSLLKLPAMLA